MQNLVSHASTLTKGLGDSMLSSLAQPYDPNLTDNNMSIIKSNQQDSLTNLHNYDHKEEKPSQRKQVHIQQSSSQEHKLKNRFRGNFNQY